MKSVVLAGTLSRPQETLQWHSKDADWSPTGKGAWRSYGGPTKSHPSRSLPLSFEIGVPNFSGHLTRIHLVGVFAMYVAEAGERQGQVGASINLPLAGGGLFHHALVNGRHYQDATDLTPIDRTNGDGTSIKTVGTIEVDGQMYRVDRLSIDIQPAVPGSRMKFTDLGTSASFVLCDAFFEYTEAKVCPFSTKSTGVSLQELGSIIRVGDRARFQKALNQLERSLESVTDLDEARGLVLTFLAIVAAAKLELGASRRLHRFQLDASRRLESTQQLMDIPQLARDLIYELAGDLLEPTGANEPLIVRALTIVDRSYSRSITDEEVAAQLGLSTSHFRYLFKQNTGQPFHQYLIALRLERARALLTEHNASVADVAQQVGFGSAAHFSRAFAKRFRVSPSAVRMAHR